MHEQRRCLVNKRVRVYEGLGSAHARSVEYQLVVFNDAVLLAKPSASKPSCTLHLKTMLQLSRSTSVGIGLPPDRKYETLTAELINELSSSKERMLFVCWLHRPLQTLYIRADTCYEAAEIVALVASVIPSSRTADTSAAAAAAVLAGIEPRSASGEGDELQQRRRSLLRPTSVKLAAHVGRDDRLIVAFECARLKYGVYSAGQVVQPPLPVGPVAPCHPPPDAAPVLLRDAVQRKARASNRRELGPHAGMVMAVWRYAAEVVPESARVRHGCLRVRCGGRRARRAWRQEGDLAADTRHGRDSVRTASDSPRVRRARPLLITLLHRQRLFAF